MINNVLLKARLPHFALARGWSVTEVIPTRRDNDIQSFTEQSSHES